MKLNEGTWSIPNNIIDLYNLNSLRHKRIEDLTKEDRSLLYGVCGSDDFFDDLESNPQENVWGLVYAYLENANDQDWVRGFHKLKYYEGYGWAFEDMRQCFRSLFTQK